MARIYEISKSDMVSWIFKDNGKKQSGDGYISYRNVICRALHCNRESYDKNKIKSELFDKLKAAVNNHKNIHIDNFISLYFIPENENNVAFLVDRTKGCFPLMFEDRNIRLIALQEAINDLDKVWEKMIEIIYSHTRWSIDLENQLKPLYTHPNRTARPGLP